MFLKREYPNLPLIIVGHSMGSLIVRAYLKKFSNEVNAVVLSGSPSDNQLAAFGKRLIRFMALFRGWNYRSPMIEKMVNGPFEKPFMKEGIVNAWICSDRDVVEEYNKDPVMWRDFYFKWLLCTV